jgi:hypothetical protein
MTEFTYTSLVGYREHVISGKATSQRNRILGCLFESDTPLDRRQLSVLTRIPINAVCGRVNTLIKSGLVRVAYEAADPATGRLAQFLEPTWPQPMQKSFEEFLR